MIRFIGLAFLFTMSSAYACPTLTGQFSCTTDDLTEEVTIREFGDQKQPIYDINGSLLVVDDVDHNIVSDDPGFHNAVFHVSCTDTTVSRHLTADFYDNQEKVGSLDSTIEYSLQDNNLVQATRGKMTNSQGETPLDDKPTVCLRMPLVTSHL